MKVKEAKRREWEEKIRECRESGESVPKWCKERQLCTSTYYRWEQEIFGGGRKKEGNAAEAMSRSPEFVEATASGQSSICRQTVMTVRMREISVDIYAGAQEEELRAMFCALEQC